jgi:hypothetical protein
MIYAIETRGRAVALTEKSDVITRLNTRARCIAITRAGAGELSRLMGGNPSWHFSRFF